MPRHQSSQSMHPVTLVGFCKVAIAVNAVLAATTLLNFVGAFSPITTHGCSSLRHRRARLYKYRKLLDSPRITLLAKDEEEHGDETDDGMSDAFASLDDEIAKQAMGSSLEEEDEMKKYTKLYKDMYHEVEQDDMYEDMLDELSTTGEMPSVQEQSSRNDVLNDIDGIGSITNDETVALAPDIIDKEKFMRQALTEAMAEVKSKTKIADDVLMNDTTKEEIHQLFDDANQKLLASIAEIREEQLALSKSSVQSRSDTRITDRQNHLADAEGSVTRLVNKVRAEASEVEKAVAELKNAQLKLNKDPLMQIANLKGGGIVKQGALVGMLLFSFRAFGDVVALLSSSGGESSHVMAAVLQGGIALACAAFFFWT